MATQEPRFSPREIHDRDIRINRALMEALVDGEGRMFADPRNLEHMNAYAEGYHKAIQITFDTLKAQGWPLPASSADHLNWEGGGDRDEPKQ